MKTIHDIEQQRQLEQERLDREKTPRERNQLGQFATPPELAREIAQYAWKLWRPRRVNVRFIDPALGSGSFYAALRQVFPQDRVTSAAGVEVDPRFARTALSLWKATGLKVMTADFVGLKPPAPRGRYNLVLTNPPYVRHHHLRSDAKQRLQAVVARTLGIKTSGLAGFYCYFLLLCDEWLAEDALSIWLIPSEFMDVNYGSAVKEYLTRHVTLLHIHRFDPSEVLFEDALVTSAVVVFSKRRPPAEHTVRLSFGGSLLKPSVEERVPLATLHCAAKWSSYPGGKRTEHAALQLGDLFEVKRGLATGANKFFILPRQDARSSGIPARFLKPILPSPRHLAATVVETEPDGYPLLEQPLALIDCDLPEEELRSRYPRFWAYLKSGRERGIHLRYLPATRSPWYSQEKRPPAPFLCTYMGRNRASPFRFICNKSQATAANVYLLLYPKDALAAALKTNPELHERTFEALQRIRPDEFLGEGRVYGGGLFKVEPKELARLSAEPVVAALGPIKMEQQTRLSFG